MHWWQPCRGRGVRTRITDDRHWLPYVTAAVRRGDRRHRACSTSAIAVHRGPDRSSRRQDDLYLQPSCQRGDGDRLRALRRGTRDRRDHRRARAAAHGRRRLERRHEPRGHRGRGESVWLAWFLDVMLTALRPDVRGAWDDADRARELPRVGGDLVAGDRARAPGTAPGTDARTSTTARRSGRATAEECRIDAIAQAWATISGSGDPDAREPALESVEEQLVDEEAGSIALLTPPFDATGARSRLHQGLRARSARERRPVHARRDLGGPRPPAQGRRRRWPPRARPHQPHAARPRSQAADRYKVEPYVVAADVYAIQPTSGAAAGRGTRDRRDGSCALRPRRCSGSRNERATELRSW